jgi:RHS repeat-associated protein
MVTLEGTHSYAYDARGQLTAVTYTDGSTEGFAYDPVGNRTSLVQAAAGGPAIATAYAYGPANRLLFSESAVETNVYTFDDAGRLVGQTVNGVSRTYGYDFQSRMTSLTDTNGSVFSYGFDGEGNRIRQSLNDCLSTRFVYDGAHAVVEMNASNEVVWAWIHGPGLDQPVERIAFINEKARTRQVVHADGLGSVAALTDESGATVQTYAYAAFGGIREQTGTDLNRVTFTAREALGDSLGFIYYRHRIYDPNTGRFTSEDPLGFIDGANRYGYCANNPVNRSDPTGLSDECMEDYPWGYEFPEPKILDDWSDLLKEVFNEFLQDPLRDWALDHPLISIPLAVTGSEIYLNKTGGGEYPFELPGRMSRDPFVRIPGLGGWGICGNVGGNISAGSSLTETHISIDEYRVGIRYERSW